MPNYGLQSGNEDLKSEEFLEKLIRSKVELGQLIDGYRAMHRMNGVDTVNHALTNARRKYLQEINAVDRRDKDDKGRFLIRWDKMLEFAKLAVEAFDREDIQR
jgi:hypothetical protein